MNTFGRHVVSELHSCNPDFLKNVEKIQNVLKEAAIISGATIVTDNFHQFGEDGVSGVVILMESHISIHTWPENSYASCDCYTCGTTCDPRLAIEYVVKMLESKDVETIYIERGTEKGMKVF